MPVNAATPWEHGAVPYPGAYFFGSHPFQAVVRTHIKPRRQQPEVQMTAVELIASIVEEREKIYSRALNGLAKEACSADEVSAALIDLRLAQLALLQEQQKKATP